MRGLSRYFDSQNPYVQEPLNEPEEPLKEPEEPSKEPEEPLKEPEEPSKELIKVWSLGCIGFRV